MARREIYVDDYDGKEHEDVEPRRFSIGHQSYTIDLSAENYAKFLTDVSEWTDKATKVESPGRAVTGAPRQRRAKGTGPAPKAATKSGKTMEEVRTWLRSEKFDVNDRGRLSKENRERWDYAHEDDPLL